jgi:hypothetical protein
MLVKGLGCAYGRITGLACPGGIGVWGWGLFDSWRFIAAGLSPKKSQICPGKRIGPVLSIKEVWHSDEIWYSYKTRLFEVRLGRSYVAFGGLWSRLFGLA